MKFSVVFDNVNNNDVLRLNETMVGMNLIRQAEKELGHKFEPEFLRDKVYGTVTYNIMPRARIELSREEAEESKHFEDGNFFNVRVPEGIFNDPQFHFIGIEDGTDIESTTNVIGEVSFAYVLNKKNIIKAWREAGYPVFWLTGDEKKEGKE